MLKILMAVAAVLSAVGGTSAQAQSAAPAAGPAEASVPAAQARARQALSAEPQEPTGRFTTAVEVRPILDVTRGSWVAVRDWDGQDLVYVTHLWSWRCGLAAVHLGVNGAPAEAWPLPDCHEDTAQPNAILDGDGLPYRAFPGGSVETLSVEITFDDLSTDSAVFERRAVLIP